MSAMKTVRQAIVKEVTKTVTPKINFSVQSVSAIMYMHIYSIMTKTRCFKLGFHKL